jgi:isopenicillin N synthase-like dioxygenase
MPNKAELETVSLDWLNSDRERFVHSFGSSFERTGFAVIKDHAIDPLLINNAYEAGKAFFALPLDQKRAYGQKNKGARGYTEFGIETAKGHTHYDLKEFWHMGRNLDPSHPYGDFMAANVWPEEIPSFEPSITALYVGFDALGTRLMSAIALYLELDEHYFSGAIKDGNSVLRLLHYPPVMSQSQSVRAGVHADINAITLLLGAEEPGLQLQDRDGSWIEVTPPDNCLVINIGDMLSRLTNNRLPSTLHRVINPIEARKDKARYSLPFFLHFHPHFLIKTLDNCIDDAHPNLYPNPITAHEFLEERLKEIKLG